MTIEKCTKKTRCFNEHICSGVNPIPGCFALAPEPPKERASLGQLDLIVMPKIRGYTEERALENGMSRETSAEAKTTWCPECGCPWFANENQCGDGFRMCCDCFQDWWIDIEYDKMAALRELPDQ